MKIIISGGAGFIGSHLCELLRASSHQITVIDNLSSGSLDNIGEIIDDVRFIEEDVADFDLSRLGEADAFVHLAAQTSVPYSVSNFYDSSRTNLLSSINVVDFCSKNKIPLVYASSAALYGGLEFADDEADMTKLLSPYAADKYALENYANVASVNYNLSSIGLRFFNVYGPRQDPKSPYSGVISKFISNIFLDQELLIYGGHQTRDFVFVADVAKVIHSALNKVTTGLYCEKINVLTGRSISIDYLADLLIELTETTCGKRYLPSRPGDPRASVGSSRKIKAFFDSEFSQMKELEEGILSTIDFVREAIQIGPDAS